MMERVNPKCRPSATMSGGSATGLWLRTYFSRQHLRAASFFTVKAHELELRHAERRERLSSDVAVEHKACVTGALLSAFAFLEAFINEIYVDAAVFTKDADYPEHTETLRKKFGSLDPLIIDLLAKIWEKGAFKKLSYSTLDMYEITLMLAHRPSFDRGRRPYQDVDALRKLRNALVHYKPEWATGGRPSAGTTAEQMRSLLRGRFALNPFAAEGNPFFPDRCLGHGAAEWALRSSLQFVKEFVDKLGVEPFLARLPDHLPTRSHQRDARLS